MISEIIEDHLYVGTIWDMIHTKEEFDIRILVAEWDNFSREEMEDLFCQGLPIFYCPIMDYSKADGDLQNCQVKMDRVELACDYINYNKTLLTCAAGVERSPLVAMWYLANYDNTIHIYTLEEAYDYVKSIRPIIENRLNWIPAEYR